MHWSDQAHGLDISFAYLMYDLSGSLIIIIIIIIKAICNAQDPPKKAANALSGSEKM